MEQALERRLAAEVVGTAILVLFGAGSVVAALRVGDGKLEYVIGPLLGGALAVFAYDAIARPRLLEAAPARLVTGRVAASARSSPRRHPRRAEMAATSAGRRL